MRKIFTVLLTIALMLPMMPTTFASANVIASGRGGTNITWSLGENGTLVISGSGEMEVYPSWLDHCGDIISVIIENGITSISKFAFCHCDNLTSVAIPDSVALIGEEAFFWCRSLTSITIPDSVLSIGDSAFYHCDSLVNVILSKNVTSLGKEAFGWCTSLTSITIPNGVASIGNFAFRYCSSLTSITIPDSVTSIGTSAFYDCKSLTSIAVSDSTTTIEKETFGWCTSLASITIPDSVTSIGDSAFLACISLTDVYYVGSKEKWSAIEIETGNDQLINAAIHFGSEGPNGDSDNSDSNNSDDSTEFIRDYESRKEWVAQHIEFANSNLYTVMVQQKFNGALGDALTEIKNDKTITAYNTLDSINSILSLDMDLTDVEEYELLLAQILFSRTGTANINEVYEEYLSSNLLTICDFLVANVPEIATPAIKERISSLKKLSKSDPKYNELLEALFKDLDGYDQSKIIKTGLSELKSANLIAIASFTSEQIETSANTLSEMVIYLAAGEAYVNTANSFGDMLLSLRRHIAIPSDNPLFEPYSVDRTITQEKADALLGSNRDPMNTPLSLNALATAIENFYLQLENYKIDKGKTVASNALVSFTKGSLLNMIKAEVEVAFSLFECLPAVKAFSAIKALFDGTQFVIDIFTGIDDRAYLGTMAMRLYVVSYIHYLTVNEAAQNAESWGVVYSGIVSNPAKAFDETVQYTQATLFDEAIETHKAILEVAIVYAQEYYATYLNSNWLAPIDKQQTSLKILKLQQQLENHVKTIRCHGEQANSSFEGDPYDNKGPFKVYTFTCPIEVTVKNQSNEVVAFLSNSRVEISEGYESYFYATETEYNSGDYAKLMIVPDEYQITITGSDIGTMNVYVTPLVNGLLGETHTFLDIPLTQNSTGHFSEALSDNILCLNVDNTEYRPIEAPGPNDTSSSDETTAPESNVENQNKASFKEPLWFGICGLAVITLLAIVVILFIKKKKH